MQRLIALAAATMLGSANAAGPAVGISTDYVAVDRASPVKRRKSVQRIGGGCLTRYRSKGKPTHPKRHRNRLHVSARTRRRHRRARK